MIRYIWVTLLIILLAGCSGTSGSGDDNGTGSSTNAVQPPDDYVFSYNGVPVYLGWEADPAVESLGAYLDCFEAPSCAFEGVDRIYYYSGFELYTYPIDGVDYIASVNLTSDIVETSKGIYLGVPLSQVIAAYGDDYTQDLGLYTYTSGKFSLSFLIADEAVIAITYSYANLE